MDRKRIQETLRRLAGHLVIDSEDKVREFDSLTEALVYTDLPEDTKLVLQSDLSINKSDLFLDNTIVKQRDEALNSLASRIDDRADDPHFRMFAREVPIREQLLHASVPTWAAGSKVSRTIGPLEHKDGRRFWYDFYPIVKLVSLYINGIAGPVLLFKVSQLNQRVRERAIPIKAAKDYSLVRGTIWIQARFLTSNAPPDTYVGLTIDGGKVSLSSKPVVQDGKVTVASSSTITVKLDLDQAEAEGVDESSQHGRDAREMDLTLPDSLEFHFSSQGREIDKVSAASCLLYGGNYEFDWNDQEQPVYDPLLQRVVFPFISSESVFAITECLSLTRQLEGKAEIIRCAWALPVATIDVNQPTEASGTGEILIQTETGLANSWMGLRGGAFQFAHPLLLVSPGLIFLADLTSGNPHARQTLELWQDELNEFGTAVELTFPLPGLFLYASGANGVELLSTLTNADFQIDRPVMVNGEPPAMHSLHSLLVLAVSSDWNLVYLFDDNMIMDAALLSQQAQDIPEPISLALSNALFKVTQVNGCLLFGSLNDDFSKVDEAFLFLTFGLYAYLPTLPDPYAANLGALRSQFSGQKDLPSGAVGFNNMDWLVCRVRWQGGAQGESGDDVKVSFHFAPQANRFGDITFAGNDVEAPDELDFYTSDPGAVVSHKAALEDNDGGFYSSSILSEIGSAITEHNLSTRSHVIGDRDLLPKYQDIWDNATRADRQNLFTLLDVSTKADLFGISFNFTDRHIEGVPTHVPLKGTGSTFLFQVQGVDVISQGCNVKAITVPQISWEPIINLSQPEVMGDPYPGPNYYPNDGGPLQVINNSENSVTLAPLPLTQHLINGFEKHPDSFAAYALMTLPFGLKALAVLQKRFFYTDQASGVKTERPGTELRINAVDFAEQGKGVKGGLQLQLNAGESPKQGQSDMFVGSTVQLNNVLDMFGYCKGDSTLGGSVTEIFNNEFLGNPPNLVKGRGVPLTRIDLSGYGASCFSNWLNPKAAFAETSQTSFDIFVGRCAHEVIQVKSMIYPWGIQVVRTITIAREGSGYVYRSDSGWRAESNGEFDFRYWTTDAPKQDPAPHDSPFEIHPGIIKGLYNVQNIIETEDIATVAGMMISSMKINDDGFYVNNTNGELNYELQPVYFDADIEIENTLSGFAIKTIGGEGKSVVPSKGIVGFVQLAPRGIPIDKETLRYLINLQQGSIGGPIDCEIDLAETGQKMRLNRFDFNNSFGALNSSIIFAAAGRGNMLLPKEGSWSMVKHDRHTGDVSPVSANLGVPVIREGKLGSIPGNDLLRIANPSELLRSPTDYTLNYGFLQSTDTQKALFLTPSFAKGSKKFLSKTPPLFADAFRIVNSKSVFPNVGDAESNFGDAISLLKNGDEFVSAGLQDGGKTVYELMNITGAFENATEHGFDLLRKQEPFKVLPDKFNLIDLGDDFRIYIEYKQDGNKGDLDFDIKSMAEHPEETWKSHMSNIGIVMDLAGINRLVTIRGEWDSKKGSEAAYPNPDLVWAPELKPVIDILQILQQIQQGGDYASAVGNGLKLAMSNKAGSWEYKFEASKEIPVLRFPPGLLYNNPNTPFKLEAGLKLGAYFNAALQVTTDANELMPSAGGVLGFYGRLSVMCVSLSAATIYAIGQVNLDVAADTKIGPSLLMKFGFGAQIVIGLPVAGNVSVMYVVGVEIFAAEGNVKVASFMLYEGHAEILGGLVGINIRIEAKGTVSRKLLPGNTSRTDLACQVTFGLDISIFLVIDINFETSWSEQRQIA